MWRLDRPTARDVLRLGALAAECWQDTPTGLVCRARVPFQSSSGASRLRELPLALKALWPAPPAAPVTVVLESAWLPVMQVQTGEDLWQRDAVEALVRHQLQQVHAAAGESTDLWELRVDHRPGDRWALGYGLPPAVRELLQAQATAWGTRWAAWEPAWAWGWQRWNPQRRWPGRSGHWAWPEQDRWLLGRFEAGRLVGFNPAVRGTLDTAALEQAVQADAWRQGHAGLAGPVVVALWQPPARLPLPSARVSWQALGRDTAAADAKAPEVNAA